MNLTRKTSHLIPAFLTALFCFSSVSAKDAVILESDFEKVGSDSWPEGWSKTDRMSLETEKGNSFIRIQSSEPDKMNMLYREINIPEGTETLKLSWKQRITGLVRGENSWFDARIMMEFLDADRKTVTPKPPAPSTGKDTKGWVEKEITFDVPETAAILKFMPTLFRVEAGSFDIDDVVITAVSKK